MPIDYTPDKPCIDVGTLGVAADIPTFQKSAVQGERLTVVDTKQVYVAMSTAGATDSSIVEIPTVDYRRRVVSAHNDFINTTSGLFGLASSNATGTITNVAATGVTDIGGLQLNSGTANGNRAALNGSNSMNQYWLGVGGPDVVVYSDITPGVVFSGANTGTWYFGLSNVISSLGSVGIYFYSVDGGNIFARTVTGGVSTGTDTDTGIAFTTAVRRKLELKYTQSDTTAKFYIDGVLVATHSTNVPVNQAIGIGHSLIKGAVGTTEGTLGLKYMGYQVIYPAARF